MFDIFLQHKAKFKHSDRLEEIRQACIEDIEARKKMLREFEILDSSSNALTFLEQAAEDNDKFWKELHTLHPELKELVLKHGLPGAIEVGRLRIRELGQSIESKWQ